MVRRSLDMSIQDESGYLSLLDRLQSKLGNVVKKEVSRLEIPIPRVIWVGQRTIFRNFMDFPKALRRDPEKLLLYLNKELASAGYISGERVIFLGRKPVSSQEKNQEPGKHREERRCGVEKNGGSHRFDNESCPATRRIFKS